MSQDNDQNPLEEIEQAYQKFHDSLNAIQKKRWEDFWKVMQEIDEAKVRQLHKKIINQEDV